jgi:alpha-beta hydrolase superfamily lysophospholipase
MRLLDDLAVVLDATRAAMPKHQPLVLLGHSLGGLVAADFVASGLRHVDGLVLSSPALALHLSGVQKALVASLAQTAAQSARGQWRAVRPSLA